MTIYLYVKTHRVTGLKYLGKTEQDPYKYRGSGKYWTNHCKKHGYEVDTQIIEECKTPEEVKERGLHYSKLWNVVESEEWANLTEETGVGFSSRQSKEINKKRFEDPAERKKTSERAKKQYEDPEQRKKASERAKKQYEDPEQRKKASERTKKQYEDPEQRKKASESTKKRYEDPEQRKKASERTRGKNNPSYDSTIYHFVHESGIEEWCTRYELRVKYSLTPDINKMVNGERKSYHGWRVKKD